MHFSKLIKKTISAGLVFAVVMTMGTGTVRSATMGSEKQMAGFSIVVDQLETEPEIVSVSESAITVSQSAISVTPAAIQVEKKTKKKESKYKNKGISIASDYVCVRSSNSTDSKIVGKLHKGSMATIMKTKGSWVKVKSGSVTGYVKKAYLAIGTKADKVSEKYSIRKAKVKTETLMVRQKKSTKAKIVDLVGEKDELKVLEETKQWIKVRVDKDTTGYVSADYVTIKDTFSTAEEIKEVTAEVSSSTGTKVRSSHSNTSRSTVTSTSTNVKASGSGTGSAIASYALQFVGNPYVYGGTSLTNGTDCSGFTQAVMRRFGIQLPRTSGSQSGSGTAISPANAQAGDLIFYAKNGSINHVALCIGGGRVVHASNPSTGIRTSNLYYRTPVAARRVL